MNKRIKVSVESNNDENNNNNKKRASNNSTTANITKMINYKEMIGQEQREHQSAYQRQYLPNKRRVVVVVNKYRTWSGFFEKCGIPVEFAMEYSEMMKNKSIKLSEWNKLSQDDLLELDVEHAKQVHKKIRQYNNKQRQELTRGARDKEKGKEELEYVRGELKRVRDELKDARDELKDTTTQLKRTKSENRMLKRKFYTIMKELEDTTL